MRIQAYFIVYDNQNDKNTYLQFINEHNIIEREMQLSRRIYDKYREIAHGIKSTRIIFKFHYSKFKIGDKRIFFIRSRMYIICFNR